MSIKEAEALGRRWLAAGRWGDGMLDGESGDRAFIPDGGDGPFLLRVDGCDSGLEYVPAVAWPDLRDAATRGAALQVVRERWQSPTVHVRQRGTVLGLSGEFLPAWEVCDLYLSHEAAKRLGTKGGPVGCSGHTSEAEALVFAIENAP